MQILTFTLRAATAVLAASLISACSSDSTPAASAPVEAGDVVAVVAARAPDFSSGAVSLVNGDSFAAQNNLAATASDIVVRAAGAQFFLIERFGLTTVKRFDLDTPNTPTLPASTQDEGDVDDSNPADLILLSPTKGYLLRYGSGTVWIVDPSATSEADFKTGEIDLSHYDADGVPEMIAGVIDQGLLYVAMQRLEGFASVKNGYVAVIDTGSDEEIVTGDDPGLPGIELPLRSPTGLVRDPASDDLLVIGSGGFDGSFTPQFEGGIARIDTGAFTAELRLDDGTADDPTFGQFGELVAVTGSRAYFTAGTAFGPQSLYRFNPHSDAAPVVVDGFDAQPLGALAVDPLNRLWVARADADAPGITVLDVSGDAETVVRALIDTDLTPINIDFAIVPDLVR